jgi:hypothetical protein
MKLLVENIRDFNLESPLAFADYVEAFDNVKRDKLFEILQNKNIPILLFKCTIENYCGNKIKVLIRSYQINIHTCSHEVRQCCPLSPTLLNIYMNEVIVKNRTILTQTHYFINQYKNKHFTFCW